MTRYNDIEIDVDHAAEEVRTDPGGNCGVTSSPYNRGKRSAI